MRMHRKLFNSFYPLHILYLKLVLSHSLFLTQRNHSSISVHTPIKKEKKTLIYTEKNAGNKPDRILYKETSTINQFFASSSLTSVARSPPRDKLTRILDRTSTPTRGGGQLLASWSRNGDWFENRGKSFSTPRQTKESIQNSEEWAPLS